MRLENQVCSLELAKKLKELEVKQSSHFGYYRINVDNKLIEDCVYTEMEMSLGGAYWTKEYSAFTVAELGEMLPFSIEAVGEFYYLTIDKAREYWHVNYEDTDGITLLKDTRLLTADTEADARAKMLIYLLENNLISV